MHQTIPEFYAGQKILVTGGTGFMGKVLVEKILRSCPDVDSIYLIVREKKGKPIDQRWREITQLPLFDRLMSERPENLNKVKLILGDLGKVNFGLSSIDLQALKENITIIFHAAADIQFSESINGALEENVKAVKTLLDLAMTFNHLKVFIHISTAYSNHNKKPSEVEEKILPPCQNWRVLLKLQETEPSTLLLLKEKLLCGHPNPYTWSKSLAEQIVNEYSIYFPVVVMRPSVVIGCFRQDPIKGWADTLGGYTALGIGNFLGTVRVLQTRGDNHNDYIPVDIATRAQLIAAKKAVEMKTRISVYNGGISKLLHFSNLKMLQSPKKIEEKLLIKEKIWPSSVWCIPNDYLYSILFIYRQVIPAIFLDILLKLSGQKPRFLKISIKVANANTMFKRFLNSKIVFPNENFESLEHYLDEKDKDQFSIDLSDLIGIEEMIVDFIYEGMLKHILKADLSKESVEKLRPRYQRIKLLRHILNVIKYSLSGYLVWRSIFYLLGTPN